MRGPLPEVFRMFFLSYDSSLNSKAISFWIISSRDLSSDKWLLCLWQPLRLLILSYLGLGSAGGLTLFSVTALLCLNACPILHLLYLIPLLQGMEVIVMTFCVRLCVCLRMRWKYSSQMKATHMRRCTRTQVHSLRLENLLSLSFTLSISFSILCLHLVSLIMF